MPTEAQAENQELWYTIFAEGHPQLKSFQKIHSRLPSPPRCKMCFAPFRGIGGVYMRLRGKGQNKRNPKYCSACDKFLESFPGGAEVNMSVIFVDVRNSVPLAEKLGPTGFGNYLTIFYKSASQALIDTDGFVIELIGDCVVGVFPPGFSGAQHARKAVDAARRLLQEIAPRAPDGSVIPIGVGVHTGPVFIGTAPAESGGGQDITIVGDTVNVAARLSDAAAEGEALISDATCLESGIDLQALEARTLILKGKTTSTAVHVITQCLANQ